MIAGTLGIVTSAPLASATSPDCVPVYPTFSNVHATTHPTNVTLSWNVNPAARVTAVFGNTTSYGFTAVQGQYDGSGSGSVFVDFLEPNKTYHFQLTGYGACGGKSTYTSSWATGSDQSFVAATISAYGYDYIYGTVTDASGHPANAGVPVMATCSTPYVFPHGTTWFDYGTTDSNGHYLIWIPGELDPYTNSYMDICQSDESPLSPGGAMAYVVCVDNLGAADANYCGAQSPTNPAPIGKVWSGYWNETIVTWAPQVVNFVLPSNYVGPYVPQVVDFSNFNASNGLAGYSTIFYSQSTKYTETMTYDWTLTTFPGSTTVMSSGSSSDTTTYGTSSYDSSSNGSLDVAEQFHTSGTVEFNALDREWAATSVNPYGTEVVRQNPPPLVSQTADWMYPGTNHAGVYTLTNWAGVGLGPGKSTGQEYLYAIGSVSSVAVAMGYSMSLSIEGAPVQLLSFSGGLSQSVDMTSQQTLSWSVTVPQSSQGGVYVCFNVYGSGDPSNHADADMIGIWEYTPGPGDAC